MVSGLISKIGKGALVFVDDGVSVNADYYQEMLEKHLVVIRRMSGKKKFTIQQDGARPHVARSTLEYLNTNVPDYIEKENWPPYSCDLNPLDYAIWGFMETLVYKNVKRFENLEDLKNAIREAWDALSIRFIRRSIDQWRLRLQKVVEVRGGHIEQYFD